MTGPVSGGVRTKGLGAGPGGSRRANPTVTAAPKMQSRNFGPSNPKVVTAKSALVRAEVKSSDPFGPLGLERKKVNLGGQVTGRVTTGEICRFKGLEGTWAP